MERRDGLFRSRWNGGTVFFVPCRLLVERRDGLFCSTSPHGLEPMSRNLNGRDSTTVELAPFRLRRNLMKFPPLVGSEGSVSPVGSAEGKRPERVKRNEQSVRFKDVLRRLSLRNIKFLPLRILRILRGHRIKSLSNQNQNRQALRGSAGFDVAQIGLEPMTLRV